MYIYVTKMVDQWIVNTSNVTNPLVLTFHVNVGSNGLPKANALPRAERYLMDLEERGERPHSPETCIGCPAEWRFDQRKMET